MNQTLKAEFKFSDTTESVTPNTVTHAAPLSAYIVSYTDGAGKKQTRIALRAPGSDATFILQERISGSFVVTNSHDWFHKALTDKLHSTGAEKGGTKVVESI